MLDEMICPLVEGAIVAKISIELCQKKCGILKMSSLEGAPNFCVETSAQSVEKRTKKVES